MRVFGLAGWLWMAVYAGLQAASAATPAKTHHAAVKHPVELRYVLNPAKSKIQFFVSSSLSDVNGVFKVWHGQLRVPSPGKAAGSSLRLTIDANTMTTGSSVKDKVIKGKDFFAVEEYPTITFVSTKVVPGGDARKFKVQGDFTLRGVTKPVELDITLAEAGKAEGLVHGDLSFNRRDFGMTKNIPFNKVADTVKVELDLDVERAQHSAAK